MLPKLQFTPDIETKYEQLLAHVNGKNKITEQLVKILQGIANWQNFYSNKLDQFAESISKLLLGQDPMKDILIILQRIISSKVQQSKKLAHQIKQDLIPHIKGSINTKTQQSFKQKQINVRNIRASMQKKVRLLFASQNNFKKAVTQINSLPKVMNLAQKIQAMNAYQKKQQQFSDMIDSYNSSLDDYMLKYTQVCEELSQMQTDRKFQFRDSVSKLVIFQINYIKNLQYNYARYMETLNKMEGKLIIEDRVIGGMQPFYNHKEQAGPIHLAKISNKNYIDSIIGKKKATQSLLTQQIKISQLKATYQPGDISIQAYHSLAKTLLPIINFIHKSKHLNLLIEVVFFSKQITTTKGRVKLSLLTAILCHELFSDQTFWIEYQKRLFDKITREQNLSSGDEQTLHKNFSNVLDRDISMLKLIQVNPYITNVLHAISQKYKQMFESKSMPNLQGNKNGQTLQTQTSIARTNSEAIKYKVYE